MALGRKSSKSRIEDSTESNSEPTTLSLRAVFDQFIPATSRFFQRFRKEGPSYPFQKEL
jgi:hypothetical protein